MSSEAVQPLRISKPNNYSSPMRMARPLSEIGSTEKRRNSPSYNQATKKMVLNQDSTEGSSPFSNSQSPRLFWRGRDPTSPGRFDPENSFEREVSVSPKRSSIENLKKASRVKNSNMFAREQKNEYDPTAVPKIERPLAAGRPLSGIGSPDSLRRGESQTKIPVLSPSKSPSKSEGAGSLSNSPQKKEPDSPTKSSLSRNGRYSTMGQQYNPDSSVLSEDDEGESPATPRGLRRHAKSVTFDAAPPQINEYEMVTPDPSSVASGSRDGSYESDEEYDESFDRESIDRDDSFDASLEDTDKTPVVLPEDWRHMSPDMANTSLADSMDDPFDGQEHSAVRPHSSGRSNSITSDGSSRPLPPLPGGQQAMNDRSRRESSQGLSAALERINGAHRSLPTPPRAAAVSKADILKMRDPAMTLEDRLRLMGLHEGPETPTRELSAEMQLPDAEKGLGINIQEDEANEESEDGSDSTELEDFKLPRISREFIMRKVKNQEAEDNETDYSYMSTPERNYGELADLDPDVPIPSREVSSHFDEAMRDHSVKEEKDESAIDLYDIPNLDAIGRSMEPDDDNSSVIHHEINHDDDEESQYSSHTEEQQAESNSTTEDEGPATPKQETLPAPATETVEEQKPAKMPDFGSFVSDDDFSLHLKPYTNPEETTGKISPTTESIPKLEAVPEFLQRPVTPRVEGPGEGTADEEPGTPGSVIHHPVDSDGEIDEEGNESSIAIPDPVATIKAPGGKLKTRPSLTPADSRAMAKARRQVSGEHPPPVPRKSPKRQSMGMEQEPDEYESSESESDDTGGLAPPQSEINRRRSLRMLDLAVDDEDLELGLSREFDRVIEAQKKGYLMRQNTKVVVASNRKFSDEEPPMSPPATDSAAAAKSPKAVTRKPSSDRAWTTEQWNGKARRKSSRTVSGRRAPSGAVPPLPGQESNANNGLGTLMEDQVVNDTDEEERGRLFVKVIGVKDLLMPLPKQERCTFQLTLDNGLHCVTTSEIELGRNAPINQEFELTVFNDLEFQLTLQTHLKRPPPPKFVAEPLPPPQPVAPQGHKRSQSALARLGLLASPKKRKEQERLRQEEQERAAQLQQQQRQQQQQLRAKQVRTSPTAWDLLHNLVASDGSFARSYLSLSTFEDQIFGRPKHYTIPCYNEWALEDDSNVSSSVKSKRGGAVRKPPYRIGSLELQLLYVPRPKNIKDDDMPKSISACARELREAEEIRDRTYEGHLSQQGGDCPYWRRRYFRLTGTKLTAYHETTRQPRATINLAKATKLIDDRSSLTQSTSTKNGGRRKSAFAEEEEGYMFVEEGFRIRFGNGEVIDFYADNAQEKDGWMKVLADAVGRDAGCSAGSAKAWTDIVLAKEKKDKLLAQTGDQSSRKSSKSVPTSPAKKNAPLPPTPVEKSARHSAIQQAPVPRVNTGRRQEVRSMIF